MEERPGVEIRRSQVRQRVVSVIDHRMGGRGRLAGGVIHWVVAGLGADRLRLARLRGLGGQMASVFGRMNQKSDQQQRS